MRNLLQSCVVAALALLAPQSESRGEGDTITFEGMCDASAASAIDAERFIVADDEDNTLRVYSRDGGGPLFAYDLSEFLGNEGKKKPKEADLEAAAQIGSHTFWITSHGRNSKGKDKPERQRLFATTVSDRNGRVEIVGVGSPYSQLLEDLIAHPPLKAFGLDAASKLAPKSPGALNIEGLAETADGHLWIAFRNPVPKGKALIVPLLNPLAVVQGERAKLGEPVMLDLGGLGIRGIDYCGDRYLIIGGVTGEGGQSKLFEWDGHGVPKELRSVPLSGLNPEGIAFHRGKEAGRYLLLSDDGSRQIDGQSCKDLSDPSLKRFRGRFVDFK